MELYGKIKQPKVFPEYYSAQIQVSDNTLYGKIIYIIKCVRTLHLQIKTRSPTNRQ